ncbi:MAG: tRNA 2-thiouridine(34) synthase MnmA [Verrucomicrobia bacterium]|nr:tRNA 2-thiouridine(34) synthase MnmA [Verrucomicrobiota bacterium]
MNNKTVVVGMSGGVDSSVTALLLKQQGCRVIGMFMKNWEEKDESGVCRSTRDYEDVVKVCEQLEIPYYSVNFVKEYQEQVFSHFLSELKQGFTPNPDILCNREIKFKVFLEKALSIGADFLATGHYCQRSEGGSPQLLKGADQGKDQSYFLYTIPSTALQKVLFPIGHLQKSEVRRLAKEHNLATSEKKDSTGICFIGKRDFKEFTGRYLGYQKGNFETLSGKVVGRHDGIAFYTIGQRKGLGIGGPGDAWFVVGKDIARNAVIIEQGEDHPSLYRSALMATDLSWVAGHPPAPLPYHCAAKVRYRQPEQPCVIEKIENGRAIVRFLEPQRAVTPRQSIVFYQGDICLGGGMISDCECIE